MTKLYSIFKFLAGQAELLRTEIGVTQIGSYIEIEES
jgi:hypothetical protein